MSPSSICPANGLAVGQSAFHRFDTVVQVVDSGLDLVQLGQNHVRRALAHRLRGRGTPLLGLLLGLLGRELQKLLLRPLRPSVAVHDRLGLGLGHPTRLFGRTAEDSGHRTALLVHLRTEVRSTPKLGTTELVPVPQIGVVAHVTEQDVVDLADVELLAHVVGTEPLVTLLQRPRAEADARHREGRTCLVLGAGLDVGPPPRCGTNRGQRGDLVTVDGIGHEISSSGIQTRNATELKHSKRGFVGEAFEESGCSLSGKFGLGEFLRTTSLKSVLDRVERGMQGDQGQNEDCDLEEHGECTYKNPAEHEVEHWAEYSKEESDEDRTEYSYEHLDEQHGISPSSSKYIEPIST